MFHTSKASIVYCKELPQSNFLGQSLRDYWGEDGLVIKRSASGKPYADAPGSFSLSHSGNLVALYINPEAPDAGCDLQIARSRYSRKEISETCFSEKERALGLGFFLLWTLKEAYLKSKGLSVFDMPDVSVEEEIGNFRSWETNHKGAAYYLSVYPAEGEIILSSSLRLRRVL